MSLVTPDVADVFDVHGSRFTSFARPATGARELCTWRLDVPPHLAGATHRPSREEVFLGIDGEMTLTIDGARLLLRPGDAIRVPARSELCVDGGPAPAAAWVISLVGLEATLADGQVMQPPWVQ